MQLSLVGKYCQFKFQNSRMNLIAYHAAPYVAPHVVYLRCTTCLWWHRLGFHYPDYYMEQVRVQHKTDQWILTLPKVIPRVVVRTT
jgi:hypothetical protein